MEDVLVITEGTEEFTESDGLDVNLVITKEGTEEFLLKVLIVIIF